MSQPILKVAPLQLQSTYILKCFIAILTSHDFLNEAIDSLTCSVDKKTKTILVANCLNQSTNIRRVIDKLCSFCLVSFGFTRIWEGT